MIKRFNNKKVLLISSPYRGYYKSIEKEIIETGADLYSYTDQPNIPFYYNILYSRAKNLALLKKYCTVAEILKGNFILNKIKHVKFDFIIIIKGMGLSSGFIRKLKELNPNAKMIMYQWDSFKVYNYASKISLFDKVFSFDYDDCKSTPSLSYLPLFYTDFYSDISKLSNTKFKYDVFFLGVAHSNRLNLINDIIDVFDSYNIKFKFLLLTGLRKKINCFLKKERFICLRKPICFKVFQSDYISAKAILDLTSPNQSGLPIRVIEAAGAKKKIITTNSNIRKEKFYSKYNVFIIGQDSWEHLIPFLNTKSKDFDSSDYSLKNFIHNIFID